MTSPSVLRYERLRDDALADARRYPESATGFVAAARVWNHRAIDERTGRLRLDPREIECHDTEGVCPECTEREADSVCGDAAPRSLSSDEREAWMAGVPAVGPL